MATTTKVDPHEILGVSLEATDEEIDKAFRTLAKQCHPDISDELDAEEKFKQVVNARDELLDGRGESVDSFLHDLLFGGLSGFKRPEGKLGYRYRAANGREIGEKHPHDSIQSGKWYIEERKSGEVGATWTLVKLGTEIPWDFKSKAAAEKEVNRLDRQTALGGVSVIGKDGKVDKARLNAISHPDADALRLLKGEEMDRLVKSIEIHGMIVPIKIYDGLILDGRNRYVASQLARVPYDDGDGDTGMMPREFERQDFETINGWSPHGEPGTPGGHIGIGEGYLEIGEGYLEPAEYVEIENDIRRHDSPSQRAAAGAILAERIKSERAARKVYEKDLAARRATANTEYTKRQLDEERQRLAKQKAAEKDQSKRANEIAAVTKGASPANVSKAERILGEDPALFKRVQAGELKVDAAFKQLPSQAKAAERLETAMLTEAREIIPETLANVQSFLAHPKSKLTKAQRDRMLKLAEEIVSRLTAWEF